MQLRVTAGSSSTEQGAYANNMFVSLRGWYVVAFFAYDNDELDLVVRLTVQMCVCISEKVASAEARR